MILAEQVYELIRQELVSASITAYSDYIPEEPTYPFCMYEIANMNNTFAFGKDYEKLTVSFNLFGNGDNPMDIIVLAEQIDDIFNCTKLDFLESSSGKKLVCNKKSNDSVEYLKEDTYWHTKQDYEFVAQRNIPS